MVLNSNDLEKIRGVIINTFNETFLQEVAQRVADILDQRFEDRLNAQKVIINSLEDKVQNINHKCMMLEERVDSQEQSTRNLNVRVFGLPEEDGTSVRTAILDLFNKKLKVKLTDKDINKCYRISAKNSQRQSTVFVRFNRDSDRLDILKNRKHLKSTGVFIKEDLTKFRLALLEKAIQKYSKQYAWCLNGNIYVKCGGQVRRIVRDKDIDELPN